MVGIILAFQTRKVKIHILNDSKSVTALIYISSIVLVVIILITFILWGYLNISAAIFYGGIIVLATFFLILIFIPKVSAHALVAASFENNIFAYRSSTCIVIQQGRRS